MLRISEATELARIPIESDPLKGERLDDPVQDRTNESKAAKLDAVQNDGLLSSSISNRCCKFVLARTQYC